MKILSVFALLAICLGPIQGNAGIITVTNSGSLRLLNGNDFAGLDGASFTWLGRFDSDAGPTSTFDNQDRFSGDVSLMILGGTSPLSGSSIVAPANEAYIGETTADFADTYVFSTITFGGLRFKVPAIRVPSGFTGARVAGNTLTPFGPQDYELTTTEVTYSSALTGTTQVSATYEIFDQSVTSTTTGTTTGTMVPAPATLALMGLGLAGLGWNRRKQK